MQKEKMEMITAVISLILSIVAFINGICKNYNIYFYISLICVLIVCLLSCFYWIKRYPVWKRYKFIRYLFFEVKENKFNIAPKMLLYLDLMKKRNNFIVNELSVTYTLKENKGVINSTVEWIMKDISNVLSNDFYFYAGIDLGEIQNQKFIISCNNVTQTINLLSDNRTNSENDIALYHWDIPNAVIKDGKIIEKIELYMEQKESFNFNKKEVIFFYPWNFAKKINKINFKIIYPKSLNKIYMQLFEAGKVKGKNYPFNHSLDTSPIERFYEGENDTLIYEYKLQKEIVMENLYYILLHKI